MTNEAEIRRGLAGVYLDKTDSCFIDGTIGQLLYRGYDIHDLAEKSTFEEVIHLLLYGKLPTHNELKKLNDELCNSRDIPQQIIEIIKHIKNAHPMDVLRTSVSALAAFDPDVTDKSIDATIHKGIRLTSKAATIVAAHHRIRNGMDPIEPNPNLSHASNFLYMLFGKELSSEESHIMDVDFILHAEHGSNASAFTARVVASTNSDLHSAIVAGIGALKGPAHGGAAEAVMKMAEDIGSPENAQEYVNKILNSGGRVMGFGHRVYKAEDPRARHLRDRSQSLGDTKGEPHWFQILSALQEEMNPYKAKGIFVNVDFYAGSIYYLMGIPDDLFISIFALGRIPGWTLNVVEQYSDNILIRPRLVYTGPKELKYTPIDDR